MKIETLTALLLAMQWVEKSGVALADCGEVGVAAVDPPEPDPVEAIRTQQPRAGDPLAAGEGFRDAAVDRVE